MHGGKTKMNMLLGVLFSCAVALGLLGRLLCTRSWKDYAALRPECRIPDSIETVLYDEALDRLCVCYNNANRVNVYDGAGTFLWSVGTPYLRNSEFELLGGELVIFDGDAYRYDAVDGSFLGLAKEAELPVKHTTWSSMETRQVGPYTFDSFEVCRILPDGSRETVVARPWWHCLFLFPLWWAVAMLAALVRGVLYLLEKLRDHREAVRQPGNEEASVVFQSPEALFLRNYYRAQTLVQAGAAALLPVGIHFAPAFTLGLFPLVIHFIGSGWVLDNKRDRLVCEQAERAEVDLWHTLKLATMAAAFLAVVVSVLLFYGSA